jgi:acyl-CoA synthetase (AMP-forming)/AMP-acid ligase II
LRSTSVALAARYTKLLPRRLRADQEYHVALMCPSGPQYLVTMLACIRLGLGVVLLACVRMLHTVHS